MIQCLVKLATVTTTATKKKNGLSLQDKGTIFGVVADGRKKTDSPVRSMFAKSYFAFSLSFFAAYKSAFPLPFPHIYAFPSTPSPQEERNLVLYRKKCGTLRNRLTKYFK